MKKLTILSVLSLAILGVVSGCASEEAGVQGDPEAAKEANSKPIEKPAVNGVEKGGGVTAPSAKLDEK